MKKDYDNAYSFDNVYGHAVELLRRHPSALSDAPGIHLDIGCGYGRIAEHIEAQTQRRYIGLDVDPVAIESLRGRGKEAHIIDLRASGERLLGEIEQLLQGRALASVSLIDVLEHVAEPAPVLGTIRELLRRHGALLILSVPNLAHRDVGFKLAFGRHDVTQAGLLDHTHVHGFTDASLRDLMAQHGLHLTDHNNVQRVRSDQHFPTLHPALAPNALLAGYLRELRDNVDDHATVNQFVGAWLPGPIEEPRFIREELQREQHRPFLSIVTRTQGRRPGTLRDALLALAAQSCDDFELIVLGHKLDHAAQLLVERILEDCPKSLREKTRFVRVEHGNRTAPLNRGFALARGDYVSILDDDDLPLTHWIETFRNLARENPGTVLRTIAVKQECDEIEGRDGVPIARAVGGFQNEYPVSFDLLQHLRVNLTPPIALAFPRAAFQDFGVRFDESLTTTEDWDFLMRTAFVCGVSSAESVTCIYRWWKSEESSRSVHSPQEWRDNYQRIISRFDRMPLLMPAGTARRLRDAINHIDWLQSELTALEGKRGLTGIVDLSDPLQVELAALLKSTSWRVTAPLRRFRSFIKAGPVPIYRLDDMTRADVERAIQDIRNSRSWRLTAPMRRLSGMRAGARANSKIRN